LSAPSDCDVLVLAAHPDDAEISCGGSILRLVAGGRRVVIVDATRGESASRGTSATRAAECAAATQLLGVGERLNLGLPDAGLDDGIPCLNPVVAALRRFRPALLLAQHETDIHPDHAAIGRLARRAFFLAGLRNYHPELGAAHRPRRLLAFPGNDHVTPSFCIDIDAQVDRKREVIECYATQVHLADASHIARGQDPLARVEARDRYFGAAIGCRAAEPFVVIGPLALPGLEVLLG
jgi:bacillithiol biosynthesis deacetylase BshB1